jgi:hypothetical protein
MPSCGMKIDNDSSPKPSDEEGRTRDPIVEELQDKDFSREEFLDAVSGAALARKGIEKLKEVAGNGDEGA